MKTLLAGELIILSISRGSNGYQTNYAVDTGNTIVPLVMKPSDLEIASANPEGPVCVMGELKNGLFKVSGFVSKAQEQALLGQKNAPHA